jgi:hypothetical protein
MRIYATIALCAGAATLAHQAAPLQAQMKVGNPSPDRIDALLNSTPGCQRNTMSYADVAQELTSVTRNAACRNHVALSPPCPPHRIWIHRYTYPLPAALWGGTAPATFTASQQNGMIAKARAAAAAIAVPPGTRLYRLSYLTKTVGTGPHPTQRVMGQAHYGACGYHQP